MRNVSLLVAIGVNEEGFREVLALERLVREVAAKNASGRSVSRWKSALMLAAARLRHVAGTKWGTRRYLDMNRLTQASEAA